MAIKLIAYLPVRGDSLEDLINITKNVCDPTANYNIEHDEWELIGAPFREGRYHTGLFVQMVAFYKQVPDVE